jgi:hypothetical protein
MLQNTIEPIRFWFLDEEIYNTLTALAEMRGLPSCPLL